MNNGLQGTRDELCRRVRTFVWFELRACIAYGVEMAMDNYLNADYISHVVAAVLWIRRKTQINRSISRLIQSSVRRMYPF